jgi:hypothetical protein
MGAVVQDLRKAGLIRTEIRSFCENIIKVAYSADSDPYLYLLFADPITGFFR